MGGYAQQAVNPFDLNFGVSPTPNAFGGQVVNPAQPSMWSRLAGNSNTMGAGQMGIGALTAGFGAFTGLKNYQLAKDQLAFDKMAFGKNWENQVKLTNNQLRDRQAARVGANPNAYQNVDAYMAENKVG